MDAKKFLEELSEAVGGSGREEAVGEIVKKYWQPLVDEITVDKLGNIIALKKGSAKSDRKAIMLAAHMDEIGLMVKKIDKEGFLWFTSVGGVDPRILLATEVLVHGRKDLIGVIGAKPPHVQNPNERNQSVPMDKLFIDCGLSYEEIIKDVRIGDFISFKQEFIELNEYTFVGKSIDNRAGLASIYVALQNLAQMDHSQDVVAVGTVQEEVGLRGAYTSTYHIEPAIGLAVDVGFTHKRGLDENITLKGGGGPGFAWGPQVHPHVFNLLKSVAEREEIAHQFDSSPYPGGTDTYAMQMSKKGVATALLSIPIGYMHTPVEIINIKDLIRTGRIIAHFCSSVDGNFMEGLSCL